RVARSLRERGRVSQSETPTISGGSRPRPPVHLLLDLAVEAGLAQGREDRGLVEILALDRDVLLGLLALVGDLDPARQGLLEPGLALPAADVDPLDGDLVGLVALFRSGNLHLHFLAVVRGGAEKAGVDQRLDAGRGGLRVRGLEGDRLTLGRVDLGHAFYL